MCKCSFCFDPKSGNNAGTEVDCFQHGICVHSDSIIRHCWHFALLYPIHSCPREHINGSKPVSSASHSFIKQSYQHWQFVAVEFALLGHIRRIWKPQHGVWAVWVPVNIKGCRVHDQLVRLIFKPLPSLQETVESGKRCNDCKSCLDFSAKSALYKSAVCFFVFYTFSFLRFCQAFWDVDIGTSTLFMVWIWKRNPLSLQVARE